MPAPPPRSKKVSEIKSTLLRPALTSHFQVYFNPPTDVRNFLKEKVTAGVASKDYDAGLFSLLCSEASLPGSSLATVEINNDYTGVTQRHAYRRLYDDRIDFTFYVDHDYSILTFFEVWIQYIMDEQVTKELTSPNYFYRANYPKGDGVKVGSGYRTAVYLDKFERDYQGRYLRYTFLEAFPISINSMPVSYESSQLLKCTVSFTYTRYVINLEKNENGNDPASGQSNTNTNANSPGNPDIPQKYGPAFGTNEEAYRQAAILRGETVDSPYGDNNLPPLNPTRRRQGLE